MELTREAIRLCEKNGHDIAAAQMQLGLDRLTSERGRGRLREDRTPWEG